MKYTSVMAIFAAMIFSPGAGRGGIGILDEVW